MNRLDLTMAGLGAIIGSGWLFGAMVASSMAGPASIFGWLIGGIAVLLIGLVYAELAGMLPEAGGIARYPHFTHGSLTGWMMGWGAFLSYSSVPAIEAEAVTQYASHYLPALAPKGHALVSPAGMALNIVLVVVFFGINSLGVKVFAKTNTTVTLIKAIMPTATVIVLLFAAHNWGNITSHATGGFAPFGVAGVLKAVGLSGIVFSFLGFRQAVDLAGEAKNPQRDVPKAIIGAVGFAIVLYALLELVFVAALPHSDLANGWAKLSLSAPFAQLASALSLGWLAILLYADAVISPAGTGNGYTASSARVLYALGNNRYLPKVFTSTNSANGAPLVSLAFGALFSILYLLPFPSWATLVGVISASTVFTYIIGPISAGVLRRTHPNAKRPFRLGGMEIIGPAAFMIGSLIIYWTGWKTDWKLVVAILGGTIVWAIANAGAKAGTIHKIDAASIASSAWLFGYLIFMLAATYFGSARFGSPYNHSKGLIHYPFDLIAVALISLAFYYWGVASGRATPETEAALQEALSLEATAPSFSPAHSLASDKSAGTEGLGTAGA